MAGAAEAGHGGVNVGEVRSQKSEVGMFQNRRVECGAAQGEVVESEVEEAYLCFGHPLERLGRTLGHGSACFNQFRIPHPALCIAHLPRCTLRLR